MRVIDDFHKKMLDGEEEAHAFVDEVFRILALLDEAFKEKDKTSYSFHCAYCYLLLEGLRKFPAVSPYAVLDIILKMENKPIQKVKEMLAQSARNALEARHDKPGGSREKQAAIRKIWASGKYSSKDICAEQECAALGMSFSAARKALRNAPAPDCT